jgi:hypothetical protein
MIKKWVNIVDKGIMYVNGSMTAIIALIFLGFVFWVLPTVAQQGVEQGLTQSIDTSMGMSAEALWAIAESYGSALRQAYIIQRWTFDVVWPAVYGGFLMTSALVLSKVIRLKGQVLLVMVIIPLAVLADFLENSLVSLVFALYPQRIPGLTELAVLMIPIKWGLVSASMLLVVGLGVWAIVRKGLKR